ncbi:MAG: glycoside hydrolase family 2 [Chitinophagaceae bacterium]|nr:MAG: glycoside hydrolase family 2 [Chitinophagaceae bacterium]
MKNLLANHKSLLLKITFCLFLFFVVDVIHAQKSSARIIVDMNKGWQFVKEEKPTENSQWQTVQLPHTWNKDDVMDEEPGYYRGAAWYKKTFAVGKELNDKQISIYFEGANQETEVFINGKKAGEHIGGYTGFSIAITSLIKYNGTNELLVKVNNRHNKNIPPLTADFTFYGGIYRDVNLVATNKIHFTSDSGSDGVYITTPSVTSSQASVQIKALLTNSTGASTSVFVTSTVLDKAGKKVAAKKSLLQVKAGYQQTLLQLIDAIKGPKLWTPENPYLYTVETKITDEKGKLLDLVINQLGFRWFSFDANKGFFLNGSPYKLVGASRHQDYKGFGNAVPDDLAIKDVVLLKEMGGNFLRVAHYPQDQSVLKACDSLGILASVEIPIVNEITETDSFYHNCERMQVEMIRQNYNHPSVIMWCYMNEVLLKTQFASDKERQKLYFNNVTLLAKRLEALTRKEDPSRYTMMAYHGNIEQYKNVGLLSIPMVAGWNLYSGWYGGTLEDFPRFLDGFHNAYPGKPFMITEYGSDADPRIRSLQPVRFDKSVEYTTHFHQYYLKEMLKRPFVAGAMIWNLADFNSETRSETMPHINNKGLLEWDRTPKDPYYYYQAVLSKKPFIKILSSSQINYGVIDSTDGAVYRPVQIASNLDSVALLLNGEQSILKVQDGLAEKRLPFKGGINTIIAEGKWKNKVYRDTITTQVLLSSYKTINRKTSFQPMNIMLGSTRYFIDKEGAWWQPDQVYKKGSWGSVGGKKFKLENNSRLPYGTDKDIAGTDDDPVYQTQLTGIQQYRLDVPAGKYEVVLHFAEFLGGKSQPIPYNLGNDEKEPKEKARVFNVRVNGKSFLQQFNLAQEYGIAKAVTRSTSVVIEEGESVIIDFEPVDGEPVLNALQLKKLDEVAAKN